MAAVAFLPQLTQLDLSHNSISDMGAVGLLPQLTQLNLANNSISELGAMALVPELTQLILAGNSISDVSALVANPGLGSGDFIGVSNNPLDTDDCGNLQILIDRGANVNSDVACP